MKIAHKLYQAGLRFVTNKQYNYPEGHYYSPIPSTKELKVREKEIWKEAPKDGIKGIDLKTAQQIHLAKELAQFYKEIPFTAEKKEGLRYHFENSFYSYTDGIVLYSMMRHFTPKHIIEVGSGFSSALMLDVNNQFFNNQIKLSFVEPYTKRLYSLISEKDKQNTVILEEAIQKVDLSFFTQLQKDDILFIDSTHVAKAGSDVNHILFEILPVLKSGVIIHFHDVFYPFEYPKPWVLGGRSWNEDYFLRAFLMYNSQFEILLFSHYLHTHCKEAFAEMPLTYKNFGGNLWLRKQ